MSVHMKILKKFKIGDIIVLCLLLLLSFIPFYFLREQTSRQPGQQLYAEIEANNHVVKKMALAKNQEWTFRHGDEYNRVLIKNKQVRVVAANCKDQICVKEGWKSHPGQTIVCLPHKFLITIKSQSGKEKHERQHFDHTLVNP